MVVSKMDEIENEGYLQHVQPDWAAVTGDAAILNKPLHYDTTAHWLKQNELISERGHYYVYSDYLVKNGVYFPNIKIGDGTSYVIDLPFLVQDLDTLISHTSNTTIHITAAERLAWNNKVSAAMDDELEETLVLSTD